MKEVRSTKCKRSLRRRHLSDSRSSHQVLWHVHMTNSITAHFHLWAFVRSLRSCARERHGGPIACVEWREATPLHRQGLERGTLVSDSLASQEQDSVIPDVVVSVAVASSATDVDESEGVLSSLSASLSTEVLDERVRVLVPVMSGSAVTVLVPLSTGLGADWVEAPEVTLALAVSESTAVVAGSPRLVVDSSAVVLL